jgi:hypothetical protein
MAAMQQLTQARTGSLREVDELLETATFSLETVRMALAIGSRADNSLLSLDERMRSQDNEERESGLVALEALDHTRAAFLDLVKILDSEEFHGIALEIRFWSTFEWSWNHLFTDPVRTTGQKALRHELVEAASRTARLQRRLRESSAIPFPNPILQ